MVDLYFFNGMNYTYYNRIKTKVYDTIDEYYLKVGSPVAQINGVNNFNYGDGIQTTQFVNKSEFGVSGEPTYMVICENGNIKSRWFVLDNEKMRNGQIRVNLRRDVLADVNQNSLLYTSDFYCDRGILTQNDPFIYKSEGGVYNQVKKSQTLLKDQSEIAWIVGYMAAGKTSDTPITINLKEKVTDKPVIVKSSLSSLPAYQYSNLCPAAERKGAYAEVYDVNLKINVFSASSTQKFQIDVIPSNTSGNYYSYKELPDSFNELGMFFVPDTIYNTTLIKGSANQIYRGFTSSTYRDKFISAYKQYLGMIPYNYLYSLLNADKNFYNVNGTVYQAIITKHLNETYSNYVAVPPDSSILVPQFLDVWNNYCCKNTKDNSTAIELSVSNTVQQNAVKCQPIMDWYEISYVPVGSVNTVGSLTITGSRRNLDDQPFSMFAIPYGSIEGGMGEEVGCSQSMATQIAAAISQATSGSNAVLYDIQLLPYCPLQDKIIGNNFLDTKDMVVDVDYSLVKNGDTTIARLFWCKSSTFSLTIKNSYHPTDYKVSNELEFCRLQSPNMASSYEFSPAKNKGIDVINVDCSYKPYQPYIHLAPNFKGLYGDQFGTGVGLICSGDFSLPMTTDAWAQFMRNNVNYENIFNRQIQNLDVKNDIARTMQMWDIGTGAIGAGVTGALAGSFGGPAGSLIGAGVAGGASLAGGIADLYYGDKLRAEDRDLTIDLHTMNTQTIKALPDTLTKVSAFTANNLIFPFIEYYQATDEEYYALKQKLNFYGMNVGKVGHVSDFNSNGGLPYIKHPFVKGTFLRMSTTEDNHFIMAINEEMNKGVYF